MRTHYRIATSLAGLATGSFIGLGLPEPQLPQLQRFSERIRQGLGGESRHGYSWVSLLWEQLDQRQAGLLRSLITTAEVTGGNGNGTLYLTVPSPDATSTGTSWVDVSGLAQLPEFNTAPYAHGVTYINVELRLNNVTIENEPSTVL